MRHDDTIVVVVLDVVEETDTVLCGEILLRSIEDTGIGICRLIGGGNLCYIGFQPDNHRLVCQSQTFHLVCSHTHDECLSRTHLVVAYPAAVLFQHPDTILLTRIDALHSVTGREGFQIQVRKCLMATVILRTHETVELAVIHIRQRVLERLRLFLQPFTESGSNFINLAVGKLYALGIAYLDVVAVLVLADALHHIGTGVVQSMFQQVHTVITAVISLYGKLLPYFHILMTALYGILVQALRVGNVDVRIVELAHIGCINTRRYPAFTEVEVQFLKSNLLRFCFLQCGKRFLDTLILTVLLHPSLDTFRLFNHIACNETVGNLIVLHQWIVVDTTGQGSEQFLFRSVRQATHIVEVYTSVFVQRSRQCLFGCVHMGNGIHGKRNWTLEDVSLHKLTILATLQRQYIPSGGIHHYQLHILSAVQIAVTGYKLIVILVQVATLRVVSLVVLHFIGI